jgi:phage portal protein BeeE
MRPIEKLLKRSWSFGGTGSPMNQGNAFANDSLWRGLSSWNGERETIENDFESYVAEAYKANGIVFACILARMMPFSEVRFQYQRLNGGRPGELFGDQSLSLLENPWPNGTTGELLSRMEQDGSLAGNFYATAIGEGTSRRIRHLRPDWMTIVSGVRGDAEASAWHLNAEVLGYIYKPPTEDGVLLTPDQVVHYSPIPDPTAQWRGMSWLTPIVREITADSAATKHKVKFFQNGAMSNLVVKHDPNLSPTQFQEAVELFDQAHRGGDNAYKTLHFGGGADATILGADLKSVDFKAIQGAGESRIAAAAGVGAIMARLSEGMQGSSLNQGNYDAAKRQFAGMTLKPLWRTAAASLAKFAAPPSGSRLWYDPRDVAFLAEDEKAGAEILQANAQTIKALTESGFAPDAVVAAVQAGDLGSLRGSHTGMFSVQLNPAGRNPTTDPAPQGGTP